MENINIWEEKSYIEQEKNCLNSSELERSDSIKNIQQKSKDKILNDTTTIKKQWTKHCPKCNKQMFFKTKYSLKRSIENNSLCSSCCSIKYFDKSEEFHRHCPKCNRLLTYKLRGAKTRADKLNKICRFCAQQLRIHKKWKVYTLEDFQRICPSCNKIITHKTKYGRNNAQKRNKICKSCSLSSKLKPIKERTRYCPKCNKKIIYKHAYLSKLLSKKLCKNCSKERFIESRKNCIISEEDRKKISINTKLAMNNLSNKKKEEMHKNLIIAVTSSEHRKKLSEKRRKRICSDETRKKHRLTILKTIQEKHGGICPMHNPNACKFIEEYGRQHNYNFQTALSGGEFYIKELGYFVDGYDKEKNVIFEYDEPHHFNCLNQLQEKDIRRMNEIKEYLKCKFIRYNEKLNEIKEY